MNGIDPAEHHQIHQLTSLQSYFYACDVPSEQIKLSFFSCQKSHRCALGGGALWQWWRRLRINDGNNAIVTRATTPAWQQQQCNCNKGNNIIAMKAKMHWLQRCLCINIGWTIAMRVTMPAWWQHWSWQLPLCYKGSNSSLMTMLAQLWQRCHQDKGNNRHHGNRKDTCTSTATTPLWGGQQCHRDDGKDAYALMMTTTPLQIGWQCQLEDSNNAIMTRATTPLWIKGNNAIVTRSTMPSWQWQGCLRIDNGNKAILMRYTITITTTAKMPAHKQQQRHCNEGNNISLTMSDKSNNASSTTAQTPCALMTVMMQSLLEQQLPL